MKISVNSVELHYEKTGFGPPLIMLHGNGETHKIFDKAAPLLAERFTVYCIDTRGHGRSSPVSEYHYVDMAEDIRCFIEALKLPSPVLYGFSDGGILGLLLASRYPGLLSRLIVSGASLNPDSTVNGWKRFFSAIYKLSKDPKMKLMLEEPNISAEMLGRIEIPVTVLAGSRDMIIERHTRAIAGGIKNSVLHILPGEGHGSYIVHKEKIAELILEACRDKAASPPPEYGGIMDVIRARHSVRAYNGKPIEGEAEEKIRQMIDEANAESGLNIQLCLGDSEALGGLIPRYGSFKNADNYIALVGKKSGDFQEKCGYYGERLVLELMKMGIGSCWIAGTYSRSKTKVTMESGEKLACIISIGYADHMGVPRKTKPLEALCDVSGEMPPWFRRGLEAAQLAPTAINQQNFKFSLEGGKVFAKAGIGPYTKIDLGIVKYHFECGASGGDWTWG